MRSHRQVILKFIVITVAKKYKLAQTCIFLHAFVIKIIIIIDCSYTVSWQSYENFIFAKGEF